MSLLYKIYCCRAAFPCHTWREVERTILSPEFCVYVCILSPSSIPAFQNMVRLLTHESCMVIFESKIKCNEIVSCMGACSFERLSWKKEAWWKMKLGVAAGRLEKIRHASRINRGHVATCHHAIWWLSSGVRVDSRAFCTWLPFYIASD